MIHILRNRFKFNHTIGVFIKLDQKSEKEILNIIDKYDWGSPFKLQAPNFVMSLREELIDD
jgi:hypothetical protein